jgi:CHAT domain-containing protein/Tfp pilus assembly protein PilF
MQILCLILLFGSSFAVSRAQATSPSGPGMAGRGIAVESVTKRFEGEKAGLQEGDILLGWTRGDQHGELQSPFDLVIIEIEQAPRGVVTVQGLRASASKEWRLGQDQWRIQARPNFTDAALAAYRQGSDLVTAGKLAPAADTWRAMAGQLERTSPPWFRPWILFQLAQAQAKIRQWTECDLAFEETLAGSKNEAGVAAQIQRSWGTTFVQRNDWPNAESHFRQALTLEQTIGKNRLATALAVDDLGALARKQGDQPKAEGYFTQALHLRESLAPQSLAVAASLNNLGELAYYGGAHLGQAEDLAQRALALAEKLAPRSLAEAQALGNLGDVVFARGNPSLAKTYYSRSFEIHNELEAGSLDFAKALSRLGRIAGQAGDLQNAEKYYSQALWIRQELAPGSVDVAMSLNLFGLVAQDRGDLARAEDYYRRSLEIRERLAPGSLDVAGTFNNLGLLAWHRGDLAQADDYHHRALMMQEKLAPGSLRVAASLNNLGLLSWQRGDLAQADSYHRRALAIREKLAPGSIDVATSLNNLGLLAWQRGDLAQADSYHHRALAIREKVAPGSLDVAMSFDNLILVYLERGDLTRAQQLSERGYAIYQRLAPGSLSVARALNNLGLVARERGDLAAAEGYYRQALSIREKLAPVSVDSGWNLNRLGLVLARRGNLDEAEEYYRGAIAIWEQLAPGSSNQADALAGLAAIRRQKGQLDEAAQLYNQSLIAIENQSARLGGGSDAQGGFRAGRESYYREYIDLLLSRGQPAAAFEVLERSRARTLLEILVAGHVDIRNGVAPELTRKERLLQTDIDAKSERRVHLLSEKQSDEQIKAVENEISALTTEYQDVQGQIQSSSPAYAALTQPQPLRAKEIQEQLLDHGTLLLEYSLGEERSHVFVVSPESLEAFELPRRSLIEAASRRLYELLTARNRQSQGEKPAERAARIARADAEYQRAAAQLSRMVIGPIAGKLAGQRLLIVSDGALHYVPFAALPVPARGKSHPAPLVAQHEIVNLPSASVLAVLRQERAGRRPAAKTVAVLADPVFDRADARVQWDEPAGLGSGRKDEPGANHPQSAEVAPNRDVSQEDLAAAEYQGSADGDESLEAAQLTRSAADAGWERTRSGEVYLPRLQSTRKEAEAIVALTPAGQSFEALDFKASRATATSADLANYRIVHFATHALLNSKHPELSGLVLSLVNQRGRQQSGFLGLEDIYNLNLPVDLVVLSACETALGKGVEGEGMVGLTRGFMYAGATRVMASLWNIDDRATADQMRYFYRATIGQGMRPSAALRAAQLKMRQDPRWTSPYFWAAFQIHGEWK